MKPVIEQIEITDDDNDVLDHVVPIDLDGEVVINPERVIKNAEMNVALAHAEHLNQIENVLQPLIEHHEEIYNRDEADNAQADIENIQQLTNEYVVLRDLRLCNFFQILQISKNCCNFRKFLEILTNSIMISLSNSQINCE